MALVKKYRFPHCHISQVLPAWQSVLACVRLAAQSEPTFPVVHALPHLGGGATLFLLQAPSWKPLAAKPLLVQHAGLQAADTGPAGLAAEACDVLPNAVLQPPWDTCRPHDKGQHPHRLLLSTGIICPKACT